MKRIIAFLLTVVLCMTAVISVSADQQFVFKGKAKDYIHVHEPVDDKGNLIKVMPGDRVERDLTVMNDVSHGTKINIYVRPIVKVVLEGSTVEKYLPDVTVTVDKSENNRMAYMFEQATIGSDENSEWIMLGTLYSGGEVNLDLTLEFPITLGNEYQDADFYLDFMIQEFPKEPDDPESPKTGDANRVVLFSCISAVALVLILLTVVSRRRREIV